MVYVLAAYSITIGVLVLYGILLQHQARIARARIEAGAGARTLGNELGGAAVGAPEARMALARGFNAGAALLAPLWAIAHGRSLMGVALLLAWVAFAAACANGLRLVALLLGPFLLGAALFFGAVGNRIAAARATDPDPVAFAQAQLPWALAGAFFATLVLPWVWHLWLASS